MLCFEKTKKPELPMEPPSFDQIGLVCWWCVHALPQRPCIHLPIQYDEKRHKWTTIGNFCSWACAKAYAIDMASAKSLEYQSLLATMRVQALGRRVPLWAAPKRQALKCFGGTMTIDEFRSYGGHVEPPQLYWPHERRVVMGIQTVDSGASTMVRKAAPTGASQKIAAIENATASTDTLRLKRNKPLVRAESKLESALGLKRKEKE